MEIKLPKFINSNKNAFKEMLKSEKIVSKILSGYKLRDENKSIKEMESQKCQTNHDSNSESNINIQKPVSKSEANWPIYEKKNNSIGTKSNSRILNNKTNN